MSTIIRPEISKKNPYYISKHRHLELKNLCLQYNELKKKSPEDNRVKMIEQSALSVDDILGVYVLEGVSNNYSYDVLKVRYNIPCCKEVYYNLYRHFFWILSNLRD